MPYNLMYSDFTLEVKKSLTPTQITGIYDVLREKEIPLLEKEVFEEEFEEPDYETENFMEALRSLIKTLPYQQREVLYGRYYRNETLEEVSKFIGLTKERVRQIESKALSNLLVPSIVSLSIKDVPDKLRHTNAWFALYNEAREAVDLSKPYTLPVSPITERPLDPNELPKLPVGADNIEILYVLSNRYALRIFENNTYYLDVYWLEEGIWKFKRKNIGCTVYK